MKRTRRCLLTTVALAHAVQVAGSGAGSAATVAGAQHGTFGNTGDPLPPPPPPLPPPPPPQIKEDDQSDDEKRPGTVKESESNGGAASSHFTTGPARYVHGDSARSRPQTVARPLQQPPPPPRPPPMTWVTSHHDATGTTWSLPTDDTPKVPVSLPVLGPDTSSQQQNGAQPMRGLEMQMAESPVRHPLHYDSTPQQSHFLGPVERQQWNNNAAAGTNPRQQMDGPWGPPPAQQHSRVPGWKRLWRRVEMSLDGLADWEEHVSQSAAQLSSNVASTLRRSSASRTNNDSDDLPHMGAPASSPKSRLDPFRRMTEMSQGKIGSNAERPQEQGLLPDAFAQTKYHNLSEQKQQRQNDQPRKPIQEQPNKSTPWSVQPLSSENSWYADVSATPRPRGMAASGGATEPKDDVSRDGKASLDPSVQRQPVADADAVRLHRKNTILLQSTDVTAPVRPRFDFDLDDDDDKVSIFVKMTRALPGLPRIQLPWRRSSLGDYSAVMDVWDAAASDGSSRQSTPGGLLSRLGLRHHARVESRGDSAPGASLALPLQDLMKRTQDGKHATLLSIDDKRQCGALGRQMAGWDLLFLTMLLVCARVTPSIDSLRHGEQILESWAPFALAAAFLSHQSNVLLRRTAMTRLQEMVAATVYEAATFGAMFMQLYTSKGTRDGTFDRVYRNAQDQVAAKVEKVRLRTNVTVLVCVLMIMTVSMLGPFLVSIIAGFVHLVRNDAWYHWPPHVTELYHSALQIFGVLGDKFVSMISFELDSCARHPLRATYEVSIAGALALVAFLPIWLDSKQVYPRADVEEEEDDEARKVYLELSQRVGQIGSSSNTRLNLMGGNDGIESLLERWYASQPIARKRHHGSSIVFLRRIWYCALSALILLCPLLLHERLSILPDGPYGVRELLRWDSLFDMSVISACILLVSFSAVTSAVQSFDGKGWIYTFIAALGEACNERKQLLQSTPSLRANAAISPLAGLAVRDLWASHATKRAWAVRGATLQCRNGEIVLVLGDDGAGKSRLLAAIAEAIIAPPKPGLSTTRARGTIALGGLALDKWDRAHLKRRLGVVLTDVNTVADTARLYSGLTLEEILERNEHSRTFSSNTADRTSMLLALRITGLEQTLLPRLPSKLSTVVTANDVDTKPSAVRPRGHLLSPADWSKLLLARVLTHAMYDNESAARVAPDKMDNRLLGTVLLLDDVAASISEIEEAHIFRDLRATGAATVVTSNRWASGRFADRVLVMKDGAVVEEGTHAELLSRGPQLSMYAAKWQAMTSL